MYFSINGFCPLPRNLNCIALQLSSCSYVAVDVYIELNEIVSPNVYSGVFVWFICLFAKSRRSNSLGPIDKKANIHYLTTMVHTLQYNSNSMFSALFWK